MGLGQWAGAAGEKGLGGSRGHRGCVGSGGGVHPWSVGGVTRDCESGCIQEMLERGNVLGGVSDAFESRSAVGDGLHELIGRGESGVSDRSVLGYDRIAQSVAVGGFDMAFVSAVMFG